MNGFDIISKLGDGAYSVVYKVKRNADGKTKRNRTNDTIIYICQRRMATV